MLSNSSLYFPAFFPPVQVDFHTDDPIEMIKRLMIGSEGTLGFVSQATYNTVPEWPHKASAFVIFPDVMSACQGASGGWPAAAAHGSGVLLCLVRGGCTAADLNPSTRLSRAPLHPPLPSHHLFPLPCSASAPCRPPCSAA